MHEHIELHGPRLRAGFVALLVGLTAMQLLAGCVSAGARQAQADYLQLVTQLPGVYDNSAQVAARPALGAVEISIQPAYAPALGKQVFYVHETAADDPRRIVSQRLVAISLNDAGVLVQRDWMFTDVPRWRSAREQPDLFKGLIVDDVREVPPRKLAFAGAELTMQIGAGEANSSLRLRRRNR